jgi:hypothetical protein
VLNRPNPNRDYRILVKYNRNAPRWHKIYEGKWTAEAAYKYKHNVAVLKRTQAVLTDVEVMGELYGNPSLVLLDAWLDEMYSLPGNVGDLPNRADFDRSFLEED